MENLLKKPSDYPQMYFRINAKKKEVVEVLVEQIMKNRLKKTPPGLILPKRNDLLAEALILGLEQIKKKI